MALVITLHHKYIQLSSSNHTIPICSRIGMVMVLGFKLWPSMIITRCNTQLFKTQMRRKRGRGEREMVFFLFRPGRDFLTSNLKFPPQNQQKHNKERFCTKAVLFSVISASSYYWFLGSTPFKITWSTIVLGCTSYTKIQDTSMKRQAEYISHEYTLVN